MRIMVTGANGLLGQKLVTLISKDTTCELIATSRGDNRNTFDRTYTYESLDITNQENINTVLAKYKPEVIIHTAAMTNVDECETNQLDCWKMNVTSVEYLIEACSIHRIFLIHLSTDFIFDGKSGPYTEEATPNPLSYYGESKLAAEQLLLESNIEWAIARTVLVYGIAHDMSRSNIILWVKHNLENNKAIHVVNDQWRTPTLAEDLAMGCFLIAKKKATGIFNISGKDLLTPYEMAINTAHYFQLDSTYIHETDGSKFTQPAKRPARTGFDITKAERELGYSPASFSEGIAILAAQLAGP